MRRWFGEYLAAFAACGRGEREPSELLAYYGVPLLMTTDSSFAAFASEAEVVAIAKQQIDAVRAANYDHSDVLSSEVVVLNGTSALFRGTFSRRRADGSEISQLTVTYVVTRGPNGRRLSVVALHNPPS